MDLDSSSGGSQDQTGISPILMKDLVAYADGSEDLVVLCPKNS